MVKDEGYRIMILNVLLMYDDKSRPTKLRNFKPMPRTYPVVLTSYPKKIFRQIGPGVPEFLADIHSDKQRLLSIK